MLWFVMWSDQKCFFDLFHPMSWEMDSFYRLGDSFEARYSSKTTSTFFIFGVDTIAKGPAWTKCSAESQLVPCLFTWWVSVTWAEQSSIKKPYVIIINYPYLPYLVKEWRVKDKGYWFSWSHPMVLLLLLWWSTKYLTMSIPHAMPCSAHFNQADMSCMGMALRWEQLRIVDSLGQKCSFSSSPLSLVSFWCWSTSLFVCHFWREIRSILSFCSHPATPYKFNRGVRSKWIILDDLGFCCAVRVDFQLCEIHTIGWPLFQFISGHWLFWVIESLSHLNCVSVLEGWKAKSDERSQCAGIWCKFLQQSTVSR